MKRAPISLRQTQPPPFISVHLDVKCHAAGTDERSRAQKPLRRDQNTAFKKLLGDLSNGESRTATDTALFFPFEADGEGEKGFTVTTELGVSLKEVKSFSIIPSGQWRANQADTSVLLPPCSLIHF